MSELETKILPYKKAAENMLHEHGVPIYDGTQPKEKWKKFMVLSGYPDAPSPGYGLVDTEIPVADILADVTKSVDVILNCPDVTIAHAQVQVHADLLTGCVYNVKIGVTVVPIGAARDVLEGKMN